MGIYLIGSEYEVGFVLISLKVIMVGKFVVGVGKCGIDGSYRKVWENFIDDEDCCGLYVVVWFDWL